MTTRIGVLVPAGNPTVEPELYRMAPASVTLHFARLDGGEGTPGAPVGMERVEVGPLGGDLPEAIEVGFRVFYSETYFASLRRPGERIEHVRQGNKLAWLRPVPVGDVQVAAGP